MKIKKGDTVIIISGTDKGKKAKVLQAMPKTSQVLVEGINIKKRHMRPTKQGQKGSIISVERPIHVSNVKNAESAKKTKESKKTPAAK